MDQKRKYSMDDDSNQPSTLSKRSRIDSSDSDGVNYISGLPSTVLAEIIQLLPLAQWPHLESVDHAFQEASTEAWRKVTVINLEYDFVLNKRMFKVDQHELIKLLLEKLLNRAVNLTDLDGFAVFAGLLLDDKPVDILVKFEHLERIRFDKTRITSAALARLLSDPKIRGNLKELTMISSLRNLSAGLISAIGHLDGMPRLQLEKLVNKRDIGQDWSDAFLHRIDETELVSLSLDVSKRNQSAVVSLLNRCHGLVELQLTFTYGGGYEQVLNAASTSSVLSALKVEAFSDGEFYTALVNLIQKLGGRPHQLKEISLIPCNYNVALAIGNQLPGLTMLDIDVNYCSPDSLNQMLMKLKRLEFVRFRELESGRLSTIAPFIMESTNLKYLGIHSFTLDNRFEFIDIVPSLHRLKELHIKILLDDGSGLTKLADKVDLPDLEELRIGICEGMDDKIITILRKLPGLRRLRLTTNRYSALSDNVLEGVSKSCPLLRELELSSNQPVTRGGMQSVVDGCCYLKIIRTNDMKERNLTIPKYRKILFANFSGR